MTGMDYDEDEDDLAMPMPGTFQNDEMPVHPKIDSCFRFAYFILSIRNSKLELGKKEFETYSSAMECLKRYFDGEDDYDLPRETKREPPEGEQHS